MITILGVDPGKTTGLAMIDVDRDMGEIHLVSSAEIELEEVAEMVFSRRGLFHNYQPDVIAIEKYTITPRTIKLSRQPDALKVTGLYEGWAMWNRTPVVFQSPADAKTVWTDSKLKARDVWVPRGHERDALRHAMLHAQRARLL